MSRALFTAVVFALLLTSFWLIGERGHLVLSSTRRGFRQQGWRSLFRLRSWHFYVYGRWPRLYISFLIHFLFGLVSRLGTRPRFWLAQHYHGKLLTPAHARAIIQLDREISLRDLDQVVPYGMARQILLQSPLDIVVYECPCRLARAQHCEPTQVCMIVGQPFCDLVLEHHPRMSRRLSRTEALDLLAAEHDRGHVHIAWFKDACLERFFAICNCCRCCCGGVDAMVHHGIPMIASSGFVAVHDPDACTGCGSCSNVCVFGAIEMNERIHVNDQQCMGCGLCAEQCAQGALALVRDTSKSPPLDVTRLVSEAISHSSLDRPDD